MLSNLQTPVQVSGLVNEVEDEIDGALCGDNIRVRLRGVEDEDISVGFVLTSPDKPVHAVTRFEAQLVILDLNSPRRDRKSSPCLKRQQLYALNASPTSRSLVGSPSGMKERPWR